MNTASTSWNPLVRWPWLWFAAAFAVFLAAWVAFFIIAANNPAKDVRDEKIPVLHSSQ
jgi:hypothetical protein